MHEELAGSGPACQEARSIDFPQQQKTSDDPGEERVERKKPVRTRTQRKRWSEAEGTWWEGQQGSKEIGFALEQS